MAGIYIILVDEHETHVNWITYCRAHFLYQALPNCQGIFRLSDPPPSLANEEAGWNLYLLCHGDDAAIGGITGDNLAAKIQKVIPAKGLGFIHIQSCKTGNIPALKFAQKLGDLGHSVIVKAPSDNATFTEEIGFRVLDRGNFTKKISEEYSNLVSQYEPKGKAIVDKHKAGGDLRLLCKKVYEITEPFWTDFSKLFNRCALQMGIGWKAYETIAGKGCKKIA